MKKLPIDLPVLAVEMENKSREGYIKLYLDTETGDIISMDEDMAMQIDDDDEPDPDEQMEWEREEFLKLRAMQEDSERYAPVPVLEAFDAFQNMEEFIQGVKDSKTKASLKRALRTRRPFKRFQEVLANDANARDRWFEFHDSWLQTKVLDWLSSIEIEPEEV